MFNQDWQEFFHRRYDAGIKVTERVIRDFIYQYRDTQITDFAMNVNAQVSSFPSKVMQSFVDKYLQKEENGVAVDYSDSMAAVMYDIFINQKLDLFQIWIEALREVGIHPWISIRMNDCHHNYRPTHVMISDHFHQHPELRRVRHRVPDETVERANDDTFYFEACYDYGLQAVRDYMLSYIEEVLERYDADGIELDFTRELPAFQIGMEAAGRKIMTEFLRQIKEKTNIAAEKRGHAIKINVLVGADPNVVFNWGYDVAQWAQQGLVDSVVALPRWETSYAETPVQLWKQILSGTQVELAAGNQILVKEYPQGKASSATLETTLGMVAAYRSLGADFTYLYNYMDMAEDCYRYVEQWYEDPELSVTVVNPEKLKKLFATAGDTDAAVHSKRRHLVTFYDFPNGWDEKTAQLPVHCTDHRFFDFVRIVTGEVPANAKVQLLVGTVSQVPITHEDVYVRLNNDAVAFHSVYFKNPEKTCAGWLFDVAKDTKICEFAVAELSTANNVPFQIIHLELLITPM